MIRAEKSPSAADSCNSRDVSIAEHATTTSFPVTARASPPGPMRRTSVTLLPCATICVTTQFGQIVKFGSVSRGASSATQVLDFNPRGSPNLLT